MNLFKLFKKKRNQWRRFVVEAELMADAEDRCSDAELLAMRQSYLDAGGKPEYFKFLYDHRSDEDDGMYDCGHHRIRTDGIGDVSCYDCGTDLTA